MDVLLEATQQASLFGDSTDLRKEMVKKLEETMRRYYKVVAHEV